MHPLIAAETRIYLVIMYATLQHYVWSVLILWDSAAANATALRVFAIALRPTEIGVVLFCVGSFALYGLLHPKMKLRIVFFFPQQIVLIISAYAALRAMYLGQFGDGVERSRSFIATDQLPYLLTALFHNVAILRMAAIQHKLKVENDRRYK